VPDASRRLVAVMMGEPKEHNRVQDSLKMLNYGYTAYDALRLYKAGQVIDSPRVYKGTENLVKAGVESDQYITVPKGMGDKVKPTVTHNDTIIAPIKKGQQIGTVKMMADGKEVAQFPLVALQDVPQAGFVGRTWDSLLMMWQKKK
jgi:D-alanyl-D-alanine carboxypeptidase (penicillin-binding protein 5/6)